MQAPCLLHVPLRQALPILARAHLVLPMPLAFCLLPKVHTA